MISFLQTTFLSTTTCWILPEIDDKTEIKLTGTKPFDEYKEAKDLVVQTKSVVIGAFTFLKLLRYTGKKNAKDFIGDIVTAYSDFLSGLDSLGAEWVRFDEPCLVHDLDEEDIALFEKLYLNILDKKGSVKTILQTCFGDVRDTYNNLMPLDFDAIGLDFIEGKETLSLIKKNGFSKNKLLFAGVVNGKNIWRNNYKNTLSLLSELKAADISTVISTSCSLLHVPYTLEHETKLSAEYTSHFAFAQEKLTELAELKKLAKQDNYEKSDLFAANASLFGSRIDCYDAAVRKRAAEIKESDFTRLPAFAEREKIQKKEFNLPLFPTTTIGSFPQTADVKANRTAYRNGKISEEEYIDFNRRKIACCIDLQEEIGLDVLVHGEYE